MKTIIVNGLMTLILSILQVVVIKFSIMLEVLCKMKNGNNISHIDAKIRTDSFLE